MGIDPSVHSAFRDLWTLETWSNYISQASHLVVNSEVYGQAACRAAAVRLRGSHRIIPHRTAGAVMWVRGSSLVPVPAPALVVVTWTALRYSPLPATRPPVRPPRDSAARADTGDLPFLGVLMSMVPLCYLVSCFSCLEAGLYLPVL